MNRVIESKIARLLGPRQLAFETAPLDSAKLSPRDVLAETLVSAISVGTELAAWRGDPPLRPGAIYPRLVGYCNVAEIAAVGNEMTGFLPGDRILTFQSHRSAFICPAEKIIMKIPAGADLIAASTTYLFHLGYNALLKGGFTPGHVVAVVGLGTIGLTTIALAASSNGCVMGFSDQNAQRDLAVEIGAKVAFAKNGDAVKHFFDATENAGADIVVSASNLWSDWRLALQLARKEGVICAIGFPGRGQPTPDFNPLDSQFFYDRQLRLIACGKSPDLDLPPHEARFTVKRNCAFLLDRILGGSLPARRLVSAVRPWNELPAAYADLETRGEGRLTTVLQWK